MATKRRRKRLFNAAYSVVLCSAFALLGCARTYRFELEGGETMTETVAIRLSQEALKKSGFDIANFEPIPYQHGPQIFARNTLGSNDGYVLWHRKRSTHVWDYMVHLEWNGREVTCDVSKGE